MLPVIDFERVLTLGAVIIVGLAATGYSTYRGVRRVAHKLRSKRA